MRPILIALPLLTGLAACADGSIGESRKNAASIAYVVPSREAAASRGPDAEEHCGALGRDAVLKNVTTLDKEAVATFDCRPRSSK